ncbi:TRAP transporter TatT component family protein [Dechloromonas sp.]|uniref:TRAP transporter TatT component family protein n=1 Tax=Dechloromonas sp. TaxID=1917218 RepID=UPI001228DF10|nr:TRAP transporter TatT component family protein [Dechloromonas sp.]MBU3698153.1 hypothetical protein [Dechloromonas sp.]TEX44450.1 MAG: hypothetical protein CFR70_13995 [Rhodocyclaceae bacterium]
MLIFKRSRSPSPLLARRLVLLAGLLALLAGCTPRQLIVGSLADELAAQGSQQESDLELARDAAPFYLKLSESVLQQQSGHRALAEAVAGGFTRYAYAFIASEAERIEANDSKQAEALRQRAAAMYRRARGHALAALEQSHPGLTAALSNSESRLILSREEAGLGYWAAAAWAGWISLSKDHPDIVADLPQAVRLARLAWEADPEWQHGTLTGLLATLEAARPGGDRQQATRWFDQAIAQSAGRNPGAYVAKAEGVALPAGDRSEFEALLNKALAVTPEKPGLQDLLMQRRARWLLEQAPDLF